MIDILVIGSGGAGLTVALEAKKNKNCKVVVLSKTYATASQTCQAQAGINAVLDETTDSTKNHIEDTIKSAHGIGNKETIEYMCQNSKKTIKWLDDIGVPFSRDENNNIAQRKLGGTKYVRSCYSSDYTGLKILHTLYDNCLKNDIEFMSEYMVLNFIVDTEINTIKGVIVLELNTGEVKQILAKTVVVASGGYGGIYEEYTTNSSATTGDMISIALNSNCDVSDMEYVQFHPTSLKGSCILISESARGAGGYLVASAAEKKDEIHRFIDELLPRDVVARAIYEKIQEGNDVYLDLRHLGIEKIQRLMPQEYNLTLEFTGLKLDQDLIPIQPAAHYTMGGIIADIDGQTNIKNLFAVGECSLNGVHGANRLAGNSLLEIITFGKRVGQNALDKSNQIASFDTSKVYDTFELEKKKLEDIYNYPNEIDFYKIKSSIGKMMYDDVGLFRKKDKMENVLAKLNQWKTEINKMGITDKSKVYNTNLKEFLEFKSILDVSISITSSAIKNETSRGAHYRMDKKS